MSAIKISISLVDVNLKRLDEIVIKEGRTRSNIINRLVESYIESYEKKLGDK